MIDLGVPVTLDCAVEFFTLSLALSLTSPSFLEERRLHGALDALEAGGRRLRRPRAGPRRGTASAAGGLPGRPKGGREPQGETALQHADAAAKLFG